MTTEIATRDEARELSLLKAVGLDRLAPEQRELALNIAQRYDLDLLMKHLVMIEGRAYITRDGLLHVAHRSGVLDGIETTEPVVIDEFWRATCSVYRKDMSRPFTYGGRYPTKGGNQKFAPEMAVKVAEVAALRRAFDVSAPTAEERWDLEGAEIVEPPAKVTLAEKVAEKAAAVTPGLTPAEFKAWYDASGIDKEYATGVAKALFPGTTGLLTDEQRAELKAVLEAAPNDEKLVEAPTEALGLS